MTSGYTGRARLTDRDQRDAAGPCDHIQRGRRERLRHRPDSAQGPRRRGASSLQSRNEEVTMPATQPFTPAWPTLALGARHV